MPSASVAAFHMIFFGMQPTLTQVPPRRWDSMSTVLGPCKAARRAQATPPLPPPMTMRSNCSGISVAFLRLQADYDEPAGRRLLLQFEQLSIQVTTRPAGAGETPTWKTHCSARTGC